MITVEKILEMKPTEFIKFYREWYKQPIDELEGEAWRVGACEYVHKNKREMLVRIIMDNHHQNICDIGCGGGQLLEWIRKRGFAGTLSGIDKEIHQVFYERAKKFRLNPIAMDYRNLFSEEYDAIIFFSSLHYSSLEEVARIIGRTEPCSFYYIVEPFASEKHPGNMTLDRVLRKKTHGRCGIFKEKELDGVFEENGFKKILSRLYLPDVLGRTHTLNVYRK